LPDAVAFSLRVQNRMVEKNKFGRTKTKRGERARPASGRGKPFLFFQD
jgi:hypothetical protein